MDKGGSRQLVFSLDDARRLCRGNTICGSLYTRNRDRLTPAARARLDRMEAALYAKAPKRDACEAGELPKAECRFDTDDGSIWWFFSDHQRKFVLTAFYLNGGGSGGLPIPVEPTFACVRGCKSKARALTELDRVAAHHATMAETYANAMSATRAAGVVERYAALMRGLAQEQRHARVLQLLHLSRRFVQSEALNALWLECENREFRTLPPWSVLSDADPVQLANPFARSILRGEAFARFVDGDAFSPRRRARRPKRETLLRDSLGLIDLMCFGTVERPLHFAHLRIAGAVSDRLAQDDGLMWVVRTELLDQLALYVASSATSAKRPDLSTGSSPTARSPQVIKRFALLTDFAVLSERLFETGEPEISAKRVWSDHGEVLEPTASVADLERMETLHISIRFLVTSVESDHVPTEELLSDPKAALSLRERLANVTRALLAPD